MAIRREGGLAQAMGIAGDGRNNRSSVGRAKRELALDRPGVGPLLRFVRVNFSQRLPDPEGTGSRFTGRRVTGGAVCAYYLNIDGLWTLLGRPDLTSGARFADGVNHDAINGVNHAVGDAANPADPVDPDAPPISVSVVNSVVSINKPRSQGKATRPPPVVVVVSGLPDDPEREAVVDELLRAWQDAIGSRRGAPPHVCTATREALRGALAAGVPVVDLRDTIAGASEPRLGGDAYRWCVEHHVWGAPLFWSKGRPSGCIVQLVQRVRAVRAADDRARRRRRDEPAPEAHERIATPDEIAAAVQAARSGRAWNG
jgi:hypothetical protein